MSIEPEEPQEIRLGDGRASWTVRMDGRLLVAEGWSQKAYIDWEGDLVVTPHHESAYVPVEVLQVLLEDYGKRVTVEEVMVVTTDYYQEYLKWVRVVVTENVFNQYGGFVVRLRNNLHEDPGNELAFARAVIRVRQLRGKLEARGVKEWTDPGFSPELEAVIERNRPIVEVMES